MSQVVIMRGIMGSGKSTWAKAQYPNAVICSADDYHVNEAGLYDFKPENNGPAHAKSVSKYVDNLLAGTPVIVVDNTNISSWEIAPYYQLALAFGCKVKIVRVHCSFEDAAKRGIHNVPVLQVWRAYQNLMTERLPPHWLEEFVFPTGENHV